MSGTGGKWDFREPDALAQSVVLGNGPASGVRRMIVGACRELQAAA
jgi:hypothetical protein